MDLTKLKMIRRQQMAVQVRSSQRMSCHRYWIAALLFILEATTASAFQVQDGTNRSPIRRTSVNGEDIDLTTLSSALSRRTILQIPSKKDHFVSLNMVKTRIGLEQRQESATPTGANDPIIFISLLHSLLSIHPDSLPKRLSPMSSKPKLVELSPNILTFQFVLFLLF